jgi:hypothetical protein
MQASCGMRRGRFNPPVADIESTIRVSKCHRRGKLLDERMHVTILLLSVRKRYTFFIDDEIATGLKALKERDGIPESEAVRRAIAEFLTARRITVGLKSERKRAATRKRP